MYLFKYVINTYTYMRAKKKNIYISVKPPVKDFIV